MADTKYTSIDDLTYSNEANTAVFMTVTFESNPTPVRFNASPDDPMDYGRQMCADALTGKFGPIKKYVPIPAPRYTREQYKQKVQMLLDSVAKQQGFDSMLAAVSYASFPNAYREVAIKLGQWRSDVWVFVESTFDKLTVDSFSIDEVEKFIKNIPTPPKF